ncbi:MAG: hypothetical protein Fur0010_13960 [Bdellovibrio sp.]
MKVLFIGKDQVYWRSLKKRFQKDFAEEKFEFTDFWPGDGKLIHQSLFEIVKTEPKAIIVDFSIETKSLLSLTRTLFRSFNYPIGVVGVWDLLAPKHLIYEGNMSGAKVNHFKGSEVGEVVAHTMFLAKEGNSPLRKFAAARAMEELWQLTVFHRMKIGFMTKSYLHVEHDVPLEEIDPILILHHFGDEFPETKFNFLRNLNKNFYYHFRFSSDIQIVGPKFPEPPKDEGPNQKARRLREEKEELEYFNRRISKFLEGQLARGSQFSKRTRVLVFDQNLLLSQLSPKPLDQYPFSIRLYRFWKKGVGMVNRVWPGVIVLCWSKETGAQDLIEMVSEIKNIEKYNPFIIVFEAPLASSEMKDKVGYQNLLCEKNPFDVDTFIKLCELYQNKEGREKTHDQSISFHDREKRLYFDKNNKESQLSLKVDISVREISESWFKFSSPLVLPFYSIFELEQPIRMFLTVVEQIEEPDWYKENNYQYKAIIHGLSETDRAQLRRLVNSSIKMEEDKKKQKSDKRE